MSNPNEYAYAKEFEGNLRIDSQPVPVKVTTRLRVMRDSSADEIGEYSSHVFDRAPEYSFGEGDLPLDSSLQAVGRHYFTW